jgi:hypothetical protein
LQFFSDPYEIDPVIKFWRIASCVGINLKEDGMRKSLLLLLAGALVLMVTSVSFASDAQTVNGWVSDSKCGVKGANAGAAECTKKCLAAGASPVVVTDTDQKVLAVDNPDALKGHEGHHVAVTGHVDGDKIHVDSLKML